MNNPQNMIELLPDYWAVEVPEGAKPFISQARYDNDVVYGNEIGTCNYVCSLPSGSWSILFTTKDATENNWIGVVDNVTKGKFQITAYADYQHPPNVYVSATQSGLSLLTSKGLHPKNNFLILKKEK